MNLGREFTCGACAAVSICVIYGVAADATDLAFEGLGDLPGWITSSVALGVSADGEVVTGRSGSSFGGSRFLGVEAYHWNRGEGLVGLGDLPGGVTDGEAVAASSDGSVVVGTSQSDHGGAVPSAHEAFRWTQATGLQPLGDLPGGLARSVAVGVSYDGSVVVGFSHSSHGGEVGNAAEAYRWTAVHGMVPLGDLPGGEVFSRAFGVSADGQAIVGEAGGPEGTEAFLWSHSTGLQGLGMLSHSDFSRANAVTADGSKAVGASGMRDSDTFSNFGEAFIWSADRGMIGLGQLSEELPFSTALATSSDGQIVVGASAGRSEREAFVWDARLGMRSVLEVVADLGLSEQTRGWRLIEARGISADGRTVVGTGVNPEGDTEAWIAVIPEPGMAGLLLAGWGVLAVRRSRSGVLTQ